MLSFTHEPKAFKNSINQLDFQPLVIKNRDPKKELYGTKPQKIISKTITNALNTAKYNKNGQHSTSRSKQIKPTPITEQNNWRDGGKIQMFDRKLMKNQLAAEERRLRAQAKKQKLQAFTEIAKNQKDIRGKTLKLQKEQQKEIQQLKELIEKERKQKQKNDMIYQQKLKKIEEERAELIKLERKIQQNGVKNQRQYKTEMNVLVKNDYPSKDRPKCHQEVRQPLNPKQRQQITQSQVNHDRNQLRQRQLQLLTKQRQKCLQQQPTLNYNPTIIPLLSRASYKIISTHISTLVELFIDDLLEEQVYLLEEIQLRDTMEKEKQKERNMMNDYYNQLAEFVNQSEEIQNRVGRYQTMKFQDLYIPKNYSKYEPKPNSKYPSFEDQTFLLQGLQDDTIEQIDNRKDRFVRFISNFDQYKKGNLTMFQKMTEELIDEAVEKMAKELDRGSGDFVQVIFRKQFE